MNYATARAFRTAIEARLRDVTRSEGPEALVALRKQVVFDRFLARLIAVSPSTWMLKGGTAMYVRMPQHYRFTRDLDLALPVPADDAMEEVLTAVRHEMDDYFSFQLIKSRRLNLRDEANTLRFTLRSRLDQRLFEDVTVDVGLDMIAPLPPDVVKGSSLLEFAGIPVLDIPTLPIEVHLAEKLHAYSRDYGQDRTNTRTKDLVDMVLIVREYPLPAGRLRTALASTFESRAMQSLPPRLGDPPDAWRGPYAVLARSVALDPDILAGHAFAAALLDPLLAGVVADDATWQPEARAWRADPAGADA